MMRQAIQWNGRNATDISEAVSGEKCSPFELRGGVYLKQGERSGEFGLVIPARHGPVTLRPGDWAAQEGDGCWVRLSDAQFQREHPADQKESE